MCRLRPLAARFRHESERGSTTQVGGNTTHSLASADNEAALSWLQRVLEHAFAQRRPELWAYLEAVTYEVMFEMELAASKKPFTVG